MDDFNEADLRLGLVFFKFSFAGDHSVLPVASADLSSSSQELIEAAKAA